MPVEGDYSKDELKKAITKPVKEVGLTPKQKLFCAEYLKDLNATQAAIRAGYSEKTARDIGCENLAKPNIQEAIQEAMKAREKRTEITQDRVLEELAILAYSNIKDYIEPQQNAKGFVIFKDIDKVSEKEARAIEAIKANYKKGRIEFKLHSKTKTLEMLCRHLGMLIDKFEHSGEIKSKLSIEDLKKSLEDYVKSGD